MADFTSNFMNNVVPQIIPFLKWGFIFFGIAILTVAGVIFIIAMKKRKWQVEIHEMKADGKLHTVDRDTLEERKIEMGRKTIYWLKKAKCEAIPPPSETVDRFKGKEEVDYLRIARDYIPVTKKMTVDYTNPQVVQRVAKAHDQIMKSLHETKTSFFNSDAVRHRFMYIPIQRTLSATMIFEPIDYDVSMMAMNEIHNADDFYASKYEFWKKYGAVIVFALTIIFLIILVTLTYQYVGDTINTMMGKVSETTGILNGLVDKLASNGAKPPS